MESVFFKCFKHQFGFTIRQIEICIFIDAVYSSASIASELKNVSIVKNEGDITLYVIKSVNYSKQLQL